MYYSEDIEIIRQLIYNGHVNLYDLHIKYRLSPAQISRSVRKLQEEQVIIVDEKTISITNFGREWVIRNRRMLFLDDKRKYWKLEKDNARFKEGDISPLEYSIEILKIIEEGE